MQRKTVRFGLWVCALAGLLRLWASPESVPLLLFAETGRHIVQAADPAPTQATAPTQPPATTAPQRPEISQTVPVFGEADLSYIQVDYASTYRPDLAALMKKPLSWKLKGDEPTVLIVHTHATESFAGTKGYRTTDERKNMLSIGDEVARLLEAGGIRVIHDRTLHDHPNYDGAYSSARKSIQAYLKENPSICLVLDLHRDAAAGDAGQLVTSATMGGQKSAQLMLVVGTDESGLKHPDWQENMALALQLTALLEQGNPGLCRPVYLRKQRFNMDLCAGSLLVEVGAAGNTHAEAILAAHALAQGILELAGGANVS